MRDWIGIDPVPVVGGNVDRCGHLDDLHPRRSPGRTHQYRGYHHDVAHMESVLRPLGQRGRAGGTIPIGTFRMTHGNDNRLSRPDLPTGTGNQPSALPSTIEFLFTVPATDPMRITYAAGSKPYLFNTFVGVNAIEITTAVDTDGDGIPTAPTCVPTATTPASRATPTA